MSGETSIEWATHTWNPTTGCDRVSPGCDHCYAMTLASRLKAMGSAAYQADGDPATSGPGFLAHEWPAALDWPLRKRKPMRVFVNSMSDLFHSNISDEYIARVFAVMAVSPQHTFQILTKRQGRMRSLLNRHAFWEAVCEQVALIAAKLNDESPGRGDRAYDVTAPLPNVWLGVSVEDQQRAAFRLDALRGTPAAVRFVSAEPLLSAVDLTPWLHATECFMGSGGPLCACIDGDARIDWVICGGESGLGARPMHPDWARSLRDQCQEADVPFLFKQWGEYTGHTMGGTPTGDGRSPWAHRECDTWVNVKTGQSASEQEALTAGGSWCGVWRVGKKAAGRDLDGRTWDEYPAPVSAGTAVLP